MNSTKKSIRTENKPPKMRMASSGGIAGKVIGIVAAIVLVLVIGVVAWEGLAPKYLISINGEKLVKNDLMYDIYQSEQLGAQIASLYEQMGYADNYFAMDNGDGTTTQDTMRSETIDGYLRNRILYAEAVANDYKVSDKEIEEAEKTADSDIEALTEKKAKELGLTKELLIERHKQEAVVAQYREDIIEGLSIDTKAIEAGVDYETYKGYKVEVLFASAMETNEAGESSEVADKEAKKAELLTALELGKSENDFSKAVDATKENAPVVFDTKVLTKESTDFSEDILKTIMSMKNGDISEVIEVANDGYYVFKMVDNDNKEEYDTAVLTAIEDAETEAFEKKYEELYGKYEIKIYNKGWNDVIFGSETF